MIDRHHHGPQPARDRAYVDSIGRDRKFAATLRLLSKRVASLEARLGMAPAPNPMHRPAERGVTLNGANHGHDPD